MKDYKRALRRHHRERLKYNRKSYWGEKLVQKNNASKVVNTPTPCSCFLCGNPRKFWKEKSRQEMQSLEYMDSSMCS